MGILSSALYSYVLDDLYADKAGEMATFLRETNVSDYWPGASPQDVAKLRLARSLLKKLSDETSPEADKRCYEKFLSVNENCKNWELKLRSSHDEELFGSFLKAIDDFFHPGGEAFVSSLFDIASRGRCGPGSSFGANGEDFYTKLFSSDLYATSPEVYSLYIEYINWFSNWRDAEINRLISFGPCKYTSHSNLSFVRKNRDISRSICTEPALNMFFQLGLGEIIADRLKSFFGIDLSFQPTRNRNLACSGSLDGSIVTIDLESASDSFSIGCAATVLPSWFTDLLDTFRTPYTRVRGEEVELHMVSTMGNGFTFPLQTAIFACVVRAATRKARLERADSDSATWGVFGDDIICPRESAADVCRLLDILGFRVNLQKSFFEGPFRESCGGDFYQGVDVRGVYLKSLLTPQTRYVAINLLNEWSARTGILLQRSVGYLVDSVRYMAIPPFENPDAGIRMPYYLVRGDGMYNSKHQRFYYRCSYPVRSSLLIDSNANVQPHPETRKRLKARISNLEGLMMSFLGGYIRNMQIVLPLKQGESVAYRTRWKISPFWGPSVEQIREAPDLLFWERWNTAVEMNVRSPRSLD